MRLLALLLAFLLLAPAVRAQIAPVRVEGKRFVTLDGRTLAIRGINLGNWLMQEGYMFKFQRAKSPRQIHEAFDRLLGQERARAFWQQFRARYVTSEDFDFIAACGFNLVRIPLHWNLFMTADGRIEGEGWELLDQALAWARRAGLLVLIDMHAAPGGQTGINHDDGPGYPLMFYVPQHRARTVALWRALAQRYREAPALIGYDLLNEPIAPYHDVAVLNPRLEPFYRQVTAEIRGVDPERIVFLEGGQWGQTFEMLGAPFAPNLAYTYHMFWASTKRDAIQRHLNFADRHRVPLLLGESGEADDAWNQGFRRLHERHGVGWVFWTYKNLDTASTVVSIARPQGWDDLVAFADGRGPLPPAAGRIVSQYLEGMRLQNGEIRRTYLESLGLKAP